MNDPPGVPPALGIEAVEFSAHGGENLTVQVTGRWRRRRPALGGQPVLVMEAHGQRHRFPAMPEPPSLTGTAPGTWRMSFSVPASLAPHLTGRTWLQFGSVVVPLPVAVELVVDHVTETAEDAIEEEAATVPVATAETLTERRLRSAELALEAARRRAVRAEDEAAELGVRIDELERELLALAAELQSRDHARRAADQRAHAEEALRLELEEELAHSERARMIAPASPPEELAQAHERIAELELEIEALLRRVDEAEQAAVAARRAQRPPEPQSGRDDPARAAAIRAELSLATRSPAAPQAPEEAVPPPALAGLEVERQMLVSRSEAPAPLEPAPPDAAPPAAAERPQPAELRSSPRVESTLADLRAELQELATLAELESVGREFAERRVAELERELEEQAARSARIYGAIDELRGELDALRAALGGDEPAGQGGAPPDPAGPVESHRLEAALTRLRTSEPQEPQEQPADDEPERTERRPATPWLASVFKLLASEEPETAGRLLLALLPAQHLVEPEPVTYDLILGELSTMRVTVADGTTAVEQADAPRPLEEVDFQVIGDLAGAARLVASGRMRRRLRRGRARARGRRKRVAVLQRLVRSPVTLDDLIDAGVRLDPVLTMKVVSLMIAPETTAGERFTIAHREETDGHLRVWLQIENGEPLAVTNTVPGGPVETIVICAADELLDVLTGRAAAGTAIVGDERPLAVLAQWLEAAQSA
jgi:hypothetical protein